MDEDRRKFLESCAAVTAAAFSLENRRISEPADVQPSELDEITITDLQKGMQTGKFTARSLTSKYLARIEEIDKHGPALKSVIEINPDALAIAESLDNERKQKGPRGLLHGIPVLLKDNINTSDRISTTAGSLALIGAKPPKDAAIVQKLRTAGAVILGKTNLSEWANIRSSHSTSGWSARGGLTKNPYALDRNPCGSSSGSAVAVSANLCAVAIGTETDGSIVCPSSMNGIVGIKPTVGLASRSGIVPISHTQDTPGPICRSVHDAAIVLGALAGADLDDPATAASNGKVFQDYTRFLDPNGLRGARIGVVRNYFGFNEAVDALMENALETMTKQGAVLVDPANIEAVNVLNDLEFPVLLYELKADLNAYLSKLGPSALVHTLQEIIEFNDRHREMEMPYFGQDLFLKAQEKGPLTDKEYLDALKLNLTLARTQGIDATMEKLRLDSLVAPTAGPAFVTDLLNGDRMAGGSSTAAAMAGYPSISVPAGFISGLPVGISFFGRAWSEPVLLKLAYALAPVFAGSRSGWEIWMKPPQTADSEKILVIDVGGTHIKMLASGQKAPREFPSGPKMTARKMVALVKRTVRDWKFDCVSMGYPGPVIHGHPLREPHNLGGGWVGFDFRKAFGHPVKIINDAAMQALGSYKGGRMLFLGLGTGLGAAMIVDGILQPMELAHLIYKHGKTYEDYLGIHGLKHLGKKKWRREVAKIVKTLKDALEADYVVLGGGNSKKLKKLPPGARLGNNENAFRGGFLMWKDMKRAAE